MSRLSKNFAFIFFLGAGLFTLGNLHANVVRPAPEFSWSGIGGKAEKSQQLQGKPVVILFAPDARSWAFRRQIGQLRHAYQRLAAAGIVCVAVLKNPSYTIRSNIPFVLATNPVTTANSFGISKGFAIAVLGRDGNLDIITNRVLTGQRILDIVNNSYSVQTSLRRN